MATAKVDTLRAGHEVTIVYVQHEESFDEETGELETEKGTYALEMTLPFAPFVGLGLGLDPDGSDPYFVTTVTVMRDGRVVVEVDSIVFPQQWPGWEKVSDDSRGLSCFY